MMKRNRGGRVGTQLKYEPDNHRMLVEMILACKPTLCFCCNEKNWIQNKMPVDIQTSTLELTQEEVTAPAHH